MRRNASRDGASLLLARFCRQITAASPFRSFNLCDLPVRAAALSFHLCRIWRLQLNDLFLFDHDL